MSKVHKCPICTKTVYALEEVKANDCKYHKTCFKCVTCLKTLNVSNYQSHDGKLFCETHLAAALSGGPVVLADRPAPVETPSPAKSARAAEKAPASAASPSPVMSASKDEKTAESRAEEARLLRRINNRGGAGTKSNSRAKKGWGARKCCPVCDKTVYPMEEMKAMEKLWHRGCFRCTSCSRSLTVGNYKAHEGQLFCDIHLPRFIVTENGLRQEETAVTTTDHIGPGAAADSSRMTEEERKEKMNEVMSNFAKADAELSAGGAHGVMGVASGAKCTTCHKEITGEYMTNVETGRPYCNPCWDTVASAKSNLGGICFKCGGKAQDGMVNAGGQKYHPPCFVCAGCEEPFAQSSAEGDSGVYVAKDGMPYCDNCNHAGVCAGCEEFIRSEVVMEVNSKTYHSACVKCATCQQVVEQFILKDDVIYCTQHDPSRIEHEKTVAANLTICAGCGEGIQGKSKKAVGKKWHAECLNCDACGVNLSGGKFYKHDDKPYCADDYRKAAAGQL